VVLREGGDLMQGEPETFYSPQKGPGNCTRPLPLASGAEILAVRIVLGAWWHTTQTAVVSVCWQGHVMMIVYWYLFSNHYTRECIHTCERERTCGSSQSSPGFVLAPSSWCRHASHAHHLPSPPCLVSSQASVVGVLRLMQTP